MIGKALVVAQPVGFVLAAKNADAELLEIGGVSSACRNGEQ